MASSTRRRAIELWQTEIPAATGRSWRRSSSAMRNPPGKAEVAGSQDALGIVLPGLNRLEYNGGYWPRAIDSVHDERILAWLEHHLQLVHAGPRRTTSGAGQDRHLPSEGPCAGAPRPKGAGRPSRARPPDVRREFRKSFEAQVALFP